MSVWLNARYVIWILEDGRLVYVRANQRSSSLKTCEIAEAKCFGSAAAAWQFIQTRHELHAKVECGYAGVADIDCRLAGIR